jgi:hypothetical protein
MPESVNEIELEVLNKLKAKNEKIQKFTTGVAGTISALALGITVSLFFGFFTDGQKSLTGNELNEKVIVIETNIEKQTKYISNMKSEIINLGDSLDSLSNLPEGSQWKTEASKISQRVVNIEDKLTALEQALTLDPAKALAIPILRKDLDNAEENIRNELKQTKAEIDRIYDQNKWFIGLMLTMALSVLGMAVGSFFGRKDT